MTATYEPTKRCPRCTAPLDAMAYASGLPFNCGGCGAKVQRKPGMGEAASESETASVESESGTGWLDYLQELLIKMILGIPWFFFDELPRRIAAAVRRWFPTLFKLAVVLLLVSVWLLLATGPIFVISRIRDGEFVWRSVVLSLPTFYRKHVTTWNVAVMSYTVLAVYASIWGALRERRRRNRASPMGGASSSPQREA